jgi:hypothetical protein
MNEQYYRNFLSRPVCFLVHKIVLQFCVFPYQLTPCVVSSISHDLLLVYVVQSCHGWNLLEVPVFRLGACGLTFVLGPLYRMAAPGNNWC